MRDDSITSCGSSQELLGDGARGEGPEVPPPPDATGLPSRPRRSRGELLKSAEVPEHQKQPYILCGYRQAPAGPCGLLATMFMLHNETVNMWTHLFGSLYAVGMGVHLVSTLDYDDHGAIEAEARWVLALVFTTAVCLLASFAYHLCNCTDQRVCQCMHKMDQTGIVCLIIMSYFSGISLFYRCFPRLRLFYLCFAGCVAAALATPFVFPSLVSHLPRHLIMCCAAGVVPAAHIMCIAPKHELMMALTYIIPMMACYGAGASIFIAQWPECWWPGRFDIFGHSHQIWHILVLGAAILWVQGNVVVLTSLECDAPDVAPESPR